MADQNSAKRKPTRRQTRELDVKISFFEGLVRRDPGDVESLQLLGDHYTQRGKYQQGLQVDEQLCRLEPRNPVVFYNLACSYSLTSRIDLAVLALEQAIALGYRDFKWLVQDPDLAALRDDPLYGNLLAKIRQMNIQVT